MTNFNKPGTIGAESGLSRPYILVYRLENIGKSVHVHMCMIIWMK